MSEDLIGYDEWGVRFFEAAVTEERILAGVNAMAGQQINFGPLGVGPGRVAKVTAVGEIGTATGQRTSTDPVQFDVRLPVALRFKLDLGVDVHRFNADVEVPLRMTARAREDLAIVIDVEPPTKDDVTVALKAQGLRATVVQYAANVEGELRRFIAKYVSRELDAPKIVAARVVDIGAAIERAAGSVIPRGDTPA
ncbi:MAG TPA: hypothetical protein VMZ66_08810 [Aeromicrobium sp.]|nr:hypothetical protein [Aeromicrobium sp.]